VACVGSGGKSYNRQVTLHLKMLDDPEVFTLAPETADQMISSMQEVFDAAEILVYVASVERLNLGFVDVEVGDCVRGQPTQEQMDLFSNNRNGVGPSEIVVYFVSTTYPPCNGCAAHPREMPGALVAEKATKWTLAHEVGHVMGLSHVSGHERLMTNNTKSIKATPVLSSEEIARMHRSGLAPLC